MCLVPWSLDFFPLCHINPWRIIVRMVVFMISVSRQLFTCHWIGICKGFNFGSPMISFDWSPFPRWFENVDFWSQKRFKQGLFGGRRYHKQGKRVPRAWFQFPNDFFKFPTVSEIFWVWTSKWHGFGANVCRPMSGDKGPWGLILGPEIFFDPPPFGDVLKF